jgi:hypothetical protein
MTMKKTVLYKHLIAQCYTLVFLVMGGFFFMASFHSPCMAAQQSTTESTQPDNTFPETSLNALMNKIHYYKPSWHLSLMFTRKDLVAIEHAVSLSEAPAPPPGVTPQETVIPKLDGTPNDRLKHLNIRPIEEAPTNRKSDIMLNTPPPPIALPAPVAPPSSMDHPSSVAMLPFTPTPPVETANPTVDKHISTKTLFLNPKNSAPRFSLDLLMYFNSKRWMVVINHHTISSIQAKKPVDVKTVESDAQIDMHIQIVNITRDQAVLSWQSNSIGDLSPNIEKNLFEEGDYYVNQDHTIRLNKAMDTIEFALGVNQIFSLYHMEILDNLQ